jgi:hypothetical protein
MEQSGVEVTTGGQISAGVRAHGRYTRGVSACKGLAISDKSDNRWIVSVP